MSTAIEAEIIRKTPGVCGGDACVGSRRIAVWMLVDARRQGFADADLLTRYQPPLTSEELTAAWEYYSANRQEIDAAIRANSDE